MSDISRKKKKRRIHDDYHVQVSMQEAGRENLTRIPSWPTVEDISCKKTKRRIHVHYLVQVSMQEARRGNLTRTPSWPGGNIRSRASVQTYTKVYVASMWQVRVYSA